MSQRYCKTPCTYSVVQHFKLLYILNVWVNTFSDVYVPQTDSWQFLSHTYLMLSQSFNTLGIPMYIKLFVTWIRLAFSTRLWITDENEANNWFDYVSNTSWSDERDVLSSKCCAECISTSVTRNNSTF